MKQARIYMKRWLGINERSKQLSTDTWYLNFANQLLSLIDESPLYSKKFEAEKVDAALSLAIYLQDAIAQSGGWKEFSNAYYGLYKSYLPFYTLTDEYLPDEINVEDILPGCHRRPPGSNGRGNGQCTASVSNGTHLWIILKGKGLRDGILCFAALNYFIMAKLSDRSIVSGRRA